MTRASTGRQTDQNVTQAASGAAHPTFLGQRLRAERERQKVGLRSFARSVGVSASLISQVERGKVMPSVGTLYSMVSELSLSMDELFQRDAAAPEPPASGPVQSADTRKTMYLASGVRWERLTTTPDPDLDFQYFEYDVGGESCPADALMTHGGKEYGYVVSGRLGLTIGADSFELGPGDAASFASTTPHRLWTIGREPAVAIWVVVGRESDSRVG